MKYLKVLLVLHVSITSISPQTAFIKNVIFDNGLVSYIDMNKLVSNRNK